MNPVRGQYTSYVNHCYIESLFSQNEKQPIVESKVLQEDYPRFLDVHDINLGDVDLHKVLVSQSLFQNSYAGLCSRDSSRF